MRTGPGLSTAEGLKLHVGRPPIRRTMSFLIKVPVYTNRNQHFRVATNTYCVLRRHVPYDCLYSPRYLTDLISRKSFHQTVHCITDFIHFFKFVLKNALRTSKGVINVFFPHTSAFSRRIHPRIVDNDFLYVICHTTTTVAPSIFLKYCPEYHKVLYSP